MEHAHLTCQEVLARLDTAKRRRAHWEPLWDEAYDHALPRRGGVYSDQRPGARRTDDIYDATAMDGAEQLAASLLGHLTPGWTPWFGLKPGPDLDAREAAAITPALQKAERVMWAHFQGSNFTMEAHQCYMDLVVGGTASLSFEETEPGHASAFRFTANPLTAVYLEEGPTGFLDGTFRVLALTLEGLRQRYPGAALPAAVAAQGARDPQARFQVVEAILPSGLTYAFAACLMDGQGSGPTTLASGRIADSPVINFRWVKSPGEIYGRSPVMKALPDIKTANKVVELILQNASIAVTGLWQAEDDGVMNLANIEIAPGAVIPKAPGSAGLEPLSMPANFDVSQLVLGSLQARIRHALLIDRLGPVRDKSMTATEVLERAAEMALLLGATYGRLQTEFLTPLILRAHAILRRRGEVPNLVIDGRAVSIDHRSPLARAQGQASVQSTLSWLQSIGSIGAEAAVDGQAVARYLAEALGVPPHLLRAPDTLQPQAEKETTL
ncbi:MAG TPA: phage tail protein [Rhodospirillaceae bacterium]|jgi:hypothetical protein|nr:head-tail connector protein [Alphaproteobacteria bacterium]HBH25970.1 phage tail protein [Rhodospirillaceae bacterium]